MRKRTKIIATVGPASGSKETLRRMVEAGVDVFRVNFSHGDADQRRRFREAIRAVEGEARRPVAICADLCGPKIRVGMIREEPVRLEAGREIVIQRTPVEGGCDRISTTLPELVDVVREGERILLADGRLRFEVTRISPPDEFTCRVVVGGPLSSGKGVNLPDTDLPISALTEKDREDIEWIARHDFDYAALSFVQRAEDLDELRRLLRDHGSSAQIIAKIEKPRALAHIDAVIDRSDAIMIARGDLGVEMEFPSVPIVQKKIAGKCERAGKPCIIATEMLDSMIRSPQPTRAEVSDVANAVFDHADAVMLSGETAIGDYPVETVDAMRRIVVEAERYAEEQPKHWPAPVIEPRTTAALAASVRTIMELRPVAAIALGTATGVTARVLAKNRPPCPILALASEPGVVRRACLYYGVTPLLTPTAATLEQFLDQAHRGLVDLGLARRGDYTIVMAGRNLSTPGGTNGLMVEQLQ